MSVWTIARAGERVKLTYTHDPLAASPFVQPCGETEATAEGDLEAWVCEQAEPWDVVFTPRGLFVRQASRPQDFQRVDAPTVVAAIA